MKRKKSKMEDEDTFRETWSTFVEILSNDMVPCETMVDVLKKATGILSLSDRIFLKQINDSLHMITQKRFWLRWLIRRLLSLCIEHKKGPKVIKICQEIMALIMTKAIIETPLLYTLTEHYVLFLEELEATSARLYRDPGQDDYVYPQGPIKLKIFGTDWAEPQLSLKEQKDPYISQNKYTEITISYGYETEILQEVVTDVLSMSIKDGVALMDYNGEFPITELDRLTARFAGLSVCIPPDRLKSLWKLLIRQLNLAEANVKRSTLDLMTALLEGGNMPSSADFDYFVEILVLLLDHFIQTSKDATNENNPSRKRARSSLEKSSDENFYSSKTTTFLKNSLSSCFKTVITSKLIGKSTIEILRSELIKIWSNSETVNIIIDLCPELQLLAWQGLLYTFETTISYMYQLPFEKVAQLAGIMLQKNKSKLVQEDTETRNLHVIVSKTLSNIIRLDVLHSDVWKSTMAFKKRSVQNNQELYGNMSSTQIVKSGTELKMKHISKTWNNLVDRTLKLDVIESNMTEFVNEMLFLTTLAKETLMLLQNKDVDCIDLEFVEGYELSHLVQGLFEVRKISLQNVQFKPSIQTFNSHFSNIIKDLLLIQPRDTFTQALLHQIIGFLTIPWMAEESKFSDLRLSHETAKQLGTISNELRLIIPNETEFAKCFINRSLIHMVFAGFTKDLAINWRLIVAEKIWAVTLESMEKGGYEEPVKYIIEALPLLLHSYGSGATTLSKKIIEEILNTQNVQLIVILAKISGKLICPLAKKTQLKRTSQDGKFVESVVCTYCDATLNVPPNCDPSNQQPPITVTSENDKSFIRLLAKLIGYNDPKVRLSVFGLVVPMSNHIGFWESHSESTANLWLSCYLEGEDEKAALHFMEFIKYLAAPAWLLYRYEAASSYQPIFANATNEESGFRQSGSLAIEEAMAADNGTILYNEKEKIWKQIYQSLRLLCDRAIISTNIDGVKHTTLVEAAVLGVVNIGLLNITLLERHIFNLLLDLYFSSSCHVSTFIHADKMIKSMVKTHKTVACNRLAAQMCSTVNANNFHESKWRIADAKNTLKLFLVLYEGDEEMTNSWSKRPGEFLSQQLQHLLPPVVLESCRSGRFNEGQANSPLQYIADELHINKKNLVAENLCHIFPHLVLHCKGKDELHRCMQFIGKETRTDFWGLVPSQKTGIINELLIKLSRGKDRVIAALEKIAKNDLEGMKIYSSNDNRLNGKDSKVISQAIVDIPKFLSPHLMGCLDYIDSRLSRHSEITQWDQNFKLEIMKSLQHLIKVMGGSYIGTAKYKLLSTINNASSGLSSHKNGNKVIIETWEALVKTIDLEQLCPIVGQILANLTLMYYNTNDSDTSNLLNIFRFLIVQNKSNLASSFNTLHFLPEYPEFSEYNQIIRNVNNITENTEFRTVLAAIAESTSNESVEAKTLALTKLLQVLKTNQGKVQGLILASDQVHPSITQLFNLLLEFSTFSSTDDKNISCIAGRCIGSLGGVDPGRLQTICDLNCDNLVGIGVLDENFGFNLLSLLTKAYLVALSSDNADGVKKCSFSIQQTLRFYGIKEYVNNNQGKNQNMSSLGARIWNRLMESSKEVLGQFFDSLYERIYSKTCHSIPIFNSPHGSNYKNWLTNWNMHLIGKITDKNVSEIFVGCIPSINCDITCAQFLLPYILVAVISQSKEHAAEVREEIEDIFDEKTSEQTRTPAEISSFLLIEECNENDLKNNGKNDKNELKYHAVQMVFATLDHMNKWIKKRYGQLTEKMKPRDDPSDYTSKDLEYLSIKEFVESIKHKTLAKVSIESKAYARSLLHLEMHLLKHPNDLNECMSSLQKIYGSLYEPDYLAGLKEIRQNDSTMFERIHHHQAMGNFQDALACCESIGRIESKSVPTPENGISLYSCILQCYLELDRPHTAFVLATGYVQSNPGWSAKLKSLQLKAAQQLGQWEDVENLLNGNDNKFALETWEANLSCLLLKVQKGIFSGKAYDRILGKSRQFQMNALSAASKEQGAYTRCYDNIVRLQILDEVECISQSMNTIKHITTEKKSDTLIHLLDNLFEEWNTRISFSRSSLSNLEQVLKVRKSLFGMVIAQIDDKIKHTNTKDTLQPALAALKAKVTRELSESWLLSAKFARKENRLEKAFSVLLEAEKFNNSELFIERSKLVWARNKHSEAIAILEKGISKQFPEYDFGFPRDKISKLEEPQRGICAKAKLLLAHYVDEAASFQPTTIIKYYEEARSMSKQSEEANYASATFFDKIIGKNYEPSDLDTRGNVVRHIIQLYAQSLTFGCDHIDQSLPRMLSLWFDYGTRYEENQKLGASGDRKSATHKLKIVEEMAKYLKKMSEAISTFVTKSFTHTPYLLMAALPQLISRICHSHGDIWNVLRVILVRLFANYPQQVLWHMVPLLKSSYRVRSYRGQAIIDQVKAKCPQLIKIIDDGLQLSDKLLKLCDEKPSGDRTGTVSLTKLMPSLVNLINNPGFSNIIMPSNFNMSMKLPRKEIGMLNHDAFSSGNAIYFERVEENVTIMRSLVKPKKLDFLGSNGKIYSFLCKPKDDLRRDCRLLEFNNLLNRLFMKDPECRKRNLHIRTYTVIPLNETNGIIEWVNNVVPLRVILNKLYKEKLGKNMMRPQEIIDYTCNPGEVEKNKKNYDYLVKRHSPTVFSDWFVNNFPDPQAWYMARLSYTRTTAVMSMVCYLIGLGDRHCENIMYDETNGDTLHVDLNCLFNKGAELKVPEIVPFRLTPNMVAGFGPTGCEGPFRLACEAALGLMRKQKDVLMSSLRPFVYDPLVDWIPKEGGPDHNKRLKAGDKSKETGEIVNETAVVTLENITSRLKGLVEEKKKTSDNLTSNDIPLSVVGQVQYLIKEATSYENLSQMYHGWAPYM